MHRLKRIVLIVTLLMACVGCDQTTKSLARDHLQSRPAITFLGDVADMALMLGLALFVLRYIQRDRHMT